MTRKVMSMTRKKIRLFRRTALAAMAVGMMFQGASCQVTDLVPLAVQVATREIGLLLSDTIFFLLDNTLVRAFT